MKLRHDTGFAAPHDIVFEDCDPATEKRRESLLALGNGMLLSRCCAPEARSDEWHYPGTYRAGCYDRLTSVIEGERVEDESIANLPNWLPLTFRAAGAAEWFAGRPVEILGCRRSLDMHRGIAHRELLWRDAEGRRTSLREQRLVSMAEPHLAAIRLELIPENWTGEIEIRSALDGDVANTNVARHRDFAHRHVEILDCEAPAPETILLRARTRQSRIAIAVAARTRAIGAERREQRAECGEKEIAETFRCVARQGEALVIEKVAAICTSRDPDIADEREAACAAIARAPDFAALATGHAEAWARLWHRCRIETAEPELTQAIAFHAFHVLQTVSPHSVGLDVGFPPRGWEEGYRGQIFWDEIFVFPFLDLRFPEIARGLLLYRYRRLDAARAAALRHGYRGAMFPWRSASTGREESRPCSSTY